MVASGRNGRDELRVIDHVLTLASSKAKEPEGLRQEAIRAAAHRTWCWAEEACRAGHPAAARRGTLEAIRMDQRLIVKPYVWGLLLASFLGYPFFERLQRARRALAR